MWKQTFSCGLLILQREAVEKQRPSLFHLHVQYLAQEVEVCCVERLPLHPEGALSAAHFRRPSFEAWVGNSVSDTFKASVSFSLLTASRSLPSFHLSPFSKPGIVGEDQREGGGSQTEPRLYGRSVGSSWRVDTLDRGAFGTNVQNLPASVFGSCQRGSVRMFVTSDGNQTCFRLRGRRERCRNENVIELL